MQGRPIISEPERFRIVAAERASAYPMVTLLVLVRSRHLISRDLGSRRYR
jgi:hypothetical protein